MSSSSIRAMNYSIRMRELAEEIQTIPQVRGEPSHYWHIFRKSRRVAGKWVFVRDYVGTKREVARLFSKYFRDGHHRLKHQGKY